MNGATTMTPAPGTVFIISAPSGAGKTSLVAALRERVDGLELSVSHTTRAPRDGECHGEHYYFVTRNDFEAEIEAGSMLEFADVFGNLYGTSARFVQERTIAGADVILEIDWQGAELARSKLDDEVSIMILPPSLDALAARLRGRGKDSEEVIARRLAAAHEEMSHVADFDYVVINAHFDLAADQLAAIVHAESVRGTRVLTRHEDVIEGLLTGS
jgi:guanylate kinase